MTGVYLLSGPVRLGDVTIVLQESAVTYAFVIETLPLLENDGIDARVYYVASAELFDVLAPERRHELFPEAHASEAIGITGFTLATLYRWVRSDSGREASLHPYRRGHFLGSGRGEVVLAEAGLDSASQFAAVRGYLDGESALQDLSRATARAPANLSTAPLRRERTRHGHRPCTANRPTPQATSSSRRERPRTPRFSHVWTFESCVLWQDTFMIFPGMLEATSKVMVGPMVTNPVQTGLDRHRFDVRHDERHVRCPHDLRDRPGRLGPSGDRQPANLHEGLRPVHHDHQGPCRGPGGCLQRSRPSALRGQGTTRCPYGRPDTAPRRCSSSEN